MRPAGLQAGRAPLGLRSECSQGGNKSGASGNTVTFPVSFSKVPVVQITMIGYHDYDGHYTAGYPSKTGFTLGRDGQNVGWMYLAVGA